MDGGIFASEDANKKKDADFTKVCSLIGEIDLMQHRVETERLRRQNEQMVALLKEMESLKPVSSQ